MPKTCTAPEFTFICPLHHGLHARPSSHLADVANQFLSEIYLTNLRNGSVADLKSVLSIIAADIRIDDECLVRVQGADEQSAMAGLRRFIGKDLPGLDALAPVSSKEEARELPVFLRNAGVKASFGLPGSRGVGQGKAVLMGTAGIISELELPKFVDRNWEEEQIRRATAAVRSVIQNKLIGATSR